MQRNPHVFRSVDLLVGDGPERFSRRLYELKNDTSENLFVLFHANASAPEFYTPEAQAIKEAGNNVLLVSLYDLEAGTGDMTVKKVQKLVDRVIDYVEANHSDKKITWGGHSIGGTMAAYAANKSTLPSGVFLDRTFCHLETLAASLACGNRCEKGLYPTACALSSLADEIFSTFQVGGNLQSLLQKDASARVSIMGGKYDEMMTSPVQDEFDEIYKSFPTQVMRGAVSQNHMAPWWKFDHKSLQTLDELFAYAVPADVITESTRVLERSKSSMSMQKTVFQDSESTRSSSTGSPRSISVHLQAARAQLEGRSSSRFSDDRQVSSDDSTCGDCPDWPEEEVIFDLPCSAPSTRQESCPNVFSPNSGENEVSRNINGKQCLAGGGRLDSGSTRFPSTDSSQTTSAHFKSLPPSSSRWFPKIRVLGRRFSSKQTCSRRE